MKYKCSHDDHHKHDEKKEVKSVKKAVKKVTKAKAKVKKVMHEFKEHELHSGSKKGPIVHNPRQAIAIALSESRSLKRKKSRK